MTLRGRYTSDSVTLAEGWQLRRLTPPSHLFGANGLRTGPDGRVYIAQVTGSRISALDPVSGDLETISPQGGDIIAPDDVAFDPDGNLYATEVMDGRVSVRTPKGTTRVLRDDLPSANGITVHNGRLFVGECRVGGRLMELASDGRILNVLAENVPMPNAMEVGPDGLLYYPAMGTNDIWRIHPDGGEPERVVGDLGVPDSVKFDAEGRIVSTQVGTGEVLRIDPRTGEREVLATISPGLDNLTFADGRLFVSDFTGRITEVLGGGETRAALPGGLNWPLDLTVDPAGDLYVADGTFTYRLADGRLEPVGSLFSEGTPGFVRGMKATGRGEFVVTTANGEIMRYYPAENRSEPLATGFDQLYGVAVSQTGTVAAVELGTGRLVAAGQSGTEVLASGLNEPVGLAFGRHGSAVVSETGRVVVVRPSGVETLVDGLEKPQGILIRGDELYIVDAGTKSLLHVDLATRERRVLATGLPVGPPPGVVPKPLRGMAPFSGPQGPFAGITAGADGTLYVSADGEGSVLAIQETGAPEAG